MKHNHVRFGCLADDVAPRVGAWIETPSFLHHSILSASPPAWGRGLKRLNWLVSMRPAGVAPRVGAWIETSQNPRAKTSGTVAPRVGAWIETQGCNRLTQNLLVAPRVGAWIETSILCELHEAFERRPPRGGVD